MRLRRRGRHVADPGPGAVDHELPGLPDGLLGSAPPTYRPRHARAHEAPRSPATGAARAQAAPSAASAPGVPVGQPVARPVDEPLRARRAPYAGGLLTATDPRGLPLDPTELWRPPPGDTFGDPRGAGVRHGPHPRRRDGRLLGDPLPDALLDEPLLDEPLLDDPSLDERPWAPDDLPGDLPDDHRPGRGRRALPVERDDEPDAGRRAAPPVLDRSDEALMRSSAVMAAGTLVSRILGMVRAAVLAWVIGTQLSGDAFTTANTLPNNLFILIGGGVLNAVLVPQITKASKRRDGHEYVDRLLTVSVTILAVSTLLVSLAAPWLVRLLAQSWGPQQLALGVAFAFWCLPQVFFYGLYTLLGQVLNTRGSFGPYMWAPVVNNVVAIAGMLAFAVAWGPGIHDVSWWTPSRVAVLAGTATLGVVAQALVLIPVLRRTGFTWTPRWGVRGVGLGTASRVAGWTFAGVGIGQLGYLVTSNVSNAGGGPGGHPTGRGRSAYDLAYLLFMLPHSLVAVSLVTAVFTHMAFAAQEDRRDDVREDLSLALRTVGVATVVSVFGFFVLGKDLTALMFAGTPRRDTDSIALIAMAMMPGLVAFSAQYLMQRVFYAYEDARTPFLVQVVVVVAWSVGDLVSLFLLPERFITIGVGATLAVSVTLGGFLTVHLLRRRLLGSVDGARVLRVHVQLAAAAAIAAAAAWGVSSGVHAVLGEERWTALPALLLGGAVLVAAYVAALRVMGVTELDDLLRPLVARLGRGRSRTAVSGRDAHRR